MGSMLTLHFSRWEMRCRCKRGKECDAVPMQREFMAKLEALRVEWDKPLSPTSARRCHFHNDQVLGSFKSQHLVGNAADFVFPYPDELAQFVILAEKYGFMGIGIGAKIGLVHIDNRKAPARWTYS